MKKDQEEMEKNKDVRVNQDLSEIDDDVPKMKSSLIFDHEIQ